MSLIAKSRCLTEFFIDKTFCTFTAAMINRNSSNDKEKSYTRASVQKCGSQAHVQHFKDAIQLSGLQWWNDAVQTKYLLAYLCPLMQVHFWNCQSAFKISGCCNTCIDFYFPWRLYCSGSGGVLFLRLVHRGTVRVPYLPDQLQSDHQRRCEYLFFTLYDLSQYSLTNQTC